MFNKNFALKKIQRAIIVVLSSFMLVACEPITMTLFGVGAATGVGYTLNGIAYKTFTAPIKKVRRASVRALGNMGMKVKSKDVNKEGEEVILAMAKDREIEVVLEPITKSATRIRTMARINALFMDRSTATEIIVQTERVLMGT